jgi:WD40 repeat protein
MLIAEGQQSFLVNTDDGQRMHDFLIAFDPNKPNDAVQFVAVGAISGDGSRVLTFDHPKLTIWDAANGKRIKTIVAKGRTIDGLAMSQDGTHFAASSSDFGIKFSIHWWDANTGAKVHVFKTPPTHAGSMALSADDKYLAAGFNNGKVIVWETKTAKQIQTFGKPAFGGADRICVSDDGQFVASSRDVSLMGGSGRPTKLWKVGSAEPVQSFPGYLLALTGNAQQVWTESNDGTAILFDAKTGNELCRIYSLDYGKQWLAVTPAGLFDGSEKARQFVAYRVSGTLKLLDDDETINRHHKPGLLQRLVGAQQ